MNIEWLQFGLAITVFLGGCFGVALRVGYIVANTVNKITLETDAKIGRMYQRFDEYKVHLESTFVRNESCHLTHNGTTTEMHGVKKQLERLNDKVDAILLRMPQGA
jgi:hypothetical protein